MLQERVLELEYVKAVAPRKQEEPCPHDDWVSAIDGSNPRYDLVIDVYVQNLLIELVIGNLELSDTFITVNSVLVECPEFEFGI